MSKKTNILDTNVLRFVTSMASRSVNSSKTEENSSSAESDKEQPRMQFEYSEKIDAEEIDLLEGSLKLLNSSESDNVVKNSGIAEEETKKHESVFSFKILSKAENEFLTGSSNGRENFVKGCKWSPDGTCILTNSDDAVLRLFDLNADMFNQEEADIKELVPSLKMQEPEIIYDYAWYPFMNSSDPTSACLFSTSKDNPVHLFDAYTGQVRCSYKGYNHVDELINAFSIAFNSDASKIYCGYKKALKIFDISIPGRNYQDIKLDADQYKIPGIISCIAFSKQQSGVYAVGSYSKHIGIYVESSNEPVCLIQSHSGGVTHLMFSPDGNKLFSGARKDSDIFCWDIRNPGKLLQLFKRDVKTNQRIYFDLFGDDCKFMASGNHDGSVRLWQGSDFDLSQEQEPVVHSFLAHNDCVNGVGFHPSHNLFATTSGQRRLFPPVKTTTKSSTSAKTSNSSSDTTSDEDDDQIGPICFENSLKIWKHFL